MPARRNLLTSPCDYVLSTGKWPTGPFRVKASDEFYFFVELAKRLRQLCEDEDRDTTITAVARDAGLSPQTVFNLVDGKTWGDLPTIYRLEVALNARLWQNNDIDQTD